MSSTNALTSPLHLPLDLAQDKDVSRGYVLGRLVSTSTSPANAEALLKPIGEVCIIVTYSIFSFSYTEEKAGSVSVNWGISYNTFFLE